jgi:hypothetical protein
MSKKWTDEEEATLIKRYEELATEQKSLQVLSGEFNRGIDSIYWKLRQLRNQKGAPIKEYDSYAKNREYRRTSKPQVVKPAKVSWAVTLDYSDRDFLDFVPMGDIHWGHPTVYANERQREKLYGYRDWIMENDALTLGMGDIIENSTKSSVGAGVFEQTLNPQEQVDQMVDWWAPMAEEGRVAAWLIGNHEMRTYNIAGMDPAAQMAAQLDVPYLQYGGFIRIRVGDVTYVTYAAHGATGSTKACEDLSLSNEADLYLMGHVHDLAHWTRTYRSLNLRNRAMEEATRHFVITGHFLGYDGSYAEMKNYTIGKSGAPRIRLDGTRRDIHVSL